MFSILVVHGKQMQALYADYLWLVILQLLLLVKFKKIRSSQVFKQKLKQQAGAAVAVCIIL